jgi:acyl-coenzyme A thioesterase PaaI-like protein
MDVTARARALIEPVPAHRTAGITVLRAADGAAEVALATPPGLLNVIGSLHSSGLTALADAVGLAAIIAASDTERDLDGVLPLGVAATMRFVSPARGRLLARCGLSEEARQALRLLLSGQQDRARATTVAAITDESGALVCEGTFQWSIRRTAPA